MSFPSEASLKIPGSHVGSVKDGASSFNNDRSGTSQVATDSEE